MAHPLDGARAKVERAKEHIHNLDNEIRPFIDRKPYGVEAKQYPNRATTHILIKEYPPAMRWGVIVGEIAFNLRTALDHVVWQLVIANNRTGNRDTGFPVFGFLDEYRANGVRKIERIAAPAQAVIEGLQPYHRGNDFAADPLFRIHHLNRDDKHRTLNLVGMAIVDGNWRLAAKEPGGYIEYLTITTPKVVMPLEDGTELMRVDFSPRNFGVQMKQHTTFGIAFDQAGPGQGEAVIPLLTQLADFTEKTIELFVSFFL